MKKILLERLKGIQTEIESLLLEKGCNSVLHNQDWSTSFKKNNKKYLISYDDLTHVYVRKMGVWFLINQIGDYDFLRLKTEIENLF